MMILTTYLGSPSRTLKVALCIDLEPLRLAPDAGEGMADGLGQIGQGGALAQRDDDLNIEARSRVKMALGLADLEQFRLRDTDLDIEEPHA